MTLLLIINIFWGLVGGFDWFFDTLDCYKLMILNLENENDIILNNLWWEVTNLITKEEYLNYLYNLEQVYHIDLNNVNDMTYKNQEKIIKDITLLIQELQKNKN